MKIESVSTADASVKQVADRIIVHIFLPQQPGHLLLCIPVATAAILFWQTVQAFRLAHAIMLAMRPSCFQSASQLSNNNGRLLTRRVLFARLGQPRVPRLGWGRQRQRARPHLALGRRLSPGAAALQLPEAAEPTAQQPPFSCLRTLADVASVVGRACAPLAREPRSAFVRACLPAYRWSVSHTKCASELDVCRACQL